MLTLTEGDQKLVKNSVREVNKFSPRMDCTPFSVLFNLCVCLFSTLFLGS